MALSHTVPSGFLAFAIVFFTFTLSPSADPVAGSQPPALSRDGTLNKVAQGAFETKKSKGPIVAPGPVEEYQLNKGPIVTEPPSAGGVPSDMSDMLKVHNERRARHCVPPLAWSPDLAKAAQAYAEKCILGQHGIDSGENVANWVTIKDGKPVLPARSDREIFEDAWYCEINNYDFSAPKIVGGFKQNCDPPVNGHFTQIVWKGTERVGCGRATCTTHGQKGTNWVCRYAPAGNSGDPGPNVPPPCQ